MRPLYEPPVSRPCPRLSGRARGTADPREEHALMSLKSKIFAAAATLTMVGGIGAAGTLTAGAASAATPSCGKNCIDIFSQKFGTHKHPNFVLDVYQATAKAGQPVILYPASNYDK